LRKWTKSACVVLACGFLLTLVVVAVGITSGPQAQASTRIARSTTQVTLTSRPTVAVAPVAPTAPAKAAAPAKTADPATRYVVQSGDTLSGIAVALAVRGGWPALYAANRRVIGPDPDVIHPGTVLMLPGQPAPVRYTVAAGDTLAGIAAAFGVPGGWPALYAANRAVIGPDPDVIHPGTVLTIARPSTRPSTPASRPSAPAPRSSSPVGHPRPTPSQAPAGQPHHSSLPARTSTQAPTGMPGWLRTMLLAVALLIGAAFLTELGLAIFRRRRRTVAQCAPLPLACNSKEPEVGSVPVQPEEDRIVLADYDRLVVTHNKVDDMVYVLRPPGEDPKAILRVARLVLAEDPYEELADRLGVPASWPME
jgi:LysM repeat protein